MTDHSLPADVRAIASLKGEFRLRSGQVSTTYFDKYRFESDPTMLNRVAAAMIPLLPQHVEALAGLELGGVPIATAISLQSGIPTVFARKKQRNTAPALLSKAGMFAASGSFSSRMS